MVWRCAKLYHSNPRASHRTLGNLTKTQREERQKLKALELHHALVSRRPPDLFRCVVQHRPLQHLQSIEGRGHEAERNDLRQHVHDRRLLNSLYLPCARHHRPVGLLYRLGRPRSSLGRFLVVCVTDLRIVPIICQAHCFKLAELHLLAPRYGKADCR